MHRLQCGEIWGGFRNQDLDAYSAGVTATLYASACDGGKGGDIYFLSVCESDLLTRIAIADVVGHGQAVSAVSQFIYDALKSHMNHPSGDTVLAEVNRVATHYGIKAMTTAAIVAFYLADRTLSVAYAGHPPALVKRKDERCWFEATIDRGPDPHPGVTNVPLAITADAMFAQQTFAMASGDRVFLYTDGVIEAPDEQGNAFGVARLTALLEAHGSDALSALKIAVVETLRRHTGGELRHDDVTLLAIEIC